MRLIGFILILPLLVLGCSGAKADPKPMSVAGKAVTTADDASSSATKDVWRTRMDKVSKSDSEWEHCLTPNQFNVLRNKGTEAPYSGEFWDNHKQGVYKCAACGVALFDADHKFDSGTGWPSFWQPKEKGNVAEHVDQSHGMKRTEVVCKECGGHLGHVFEDGPPPTGLRFCINSAALKFEERESAGEEKK